MEPVLPPNRVLTVPNALSAVRLALVPVFVYALLVAHANGWAVAILMFSGASDWADGKSPGCSTSPRGWVCCSTPRWTASTWWSCPSCWR